MNSAAPLCQACRQPCRGGYVMNRSNYPVCADEMACYTSFAAFRAGAPKAPKAPSAASAKESPEAAS